MANSLVNRTINLHLIHKLKITCLACLLQVNLFTIIFGKNVRALLSSRPKTSIRVNSDGVRRRSDDSRLGAVPDVSLKSVSEIYKVFHHRESFVKQVDEIHIPNCRFQFSWWNLIASSSWKCHCQIFSEIPIIPCCSLIMTLPWLQPENDCSFSFRERRSSRRWTHLKWYSKFS